MTPARILTLACLVTVAGAMSACGIIVPVTALAPTPHAAATGPCATPGPAAKQDAFGETVTLTTQPSGLQIGDITIGCGATVRAGTQLAAQYTAWLTDGSLISTSRQPQAQPLFITVGSGQIIPGLEQGVVGMKVGGKRRIVIPPALGFGSQGRAPAIPPDATLVFDVEVTETA